jgi:NAD-dependent SIR2 family protein deacetylase
MDASLADLDSNLRRAADALRQADALLIGAGAGMGVDSGLPDFRGDEGFWKAYPPFRGRRFADMSNPQWFRTDPELAWGFFGHRMNLYRSAVPHRGFEILRRWAERLPHGCFVFTSNVDGQFQKAGFAADRIVECHGSIGHLQCTKPCGLRIWSSAETSVDVDMETIRARSELPRCPDCGALARPNILMFGDWDWNAERTEEQGVRYRRWLEQVDGSRVVAVEMGAGLAIPTVRYACESVGTPLIRINPREADAPGGISLPLGAMEALARIDALQAQG